MKIAVCLKEVPSRESRYQLNASATWIDESQVSFQASECDEYALEEALKLKESHGGEVVILSIGPARSEKVIRKGLAMGADRAVLIQDEDRRISDPLLAARLLAEVAGPEGFDLILTGTQSDDYGWGQTGVMLAELLDRPHATIVMEIEADPDRALARVLREMESGWFQRLELPLPALLTIQAGISTIRYASLKGIMQARTKEIRKVNLEELGSGEAGQTYLKVARLAFPEVKSEAVLLEGEPEQVAADLVERLKKDRVL